MQAVPSVLPRHARQYHLNLARPLPPEVARIAVPAELKRAVPKRLAQFRAGRYCAMKAMESLDPRFVECPIGRRSNGAPLWPEGLTGSITHTDDFVAAAVALAADTAALGIDTERIMSESQARDVGDLVASPDEGEDARAAGMGRVEALTLVFSAKESIFKCLHPMTGRYFDFHDVRIVGVDTRARSFTARIERTLSEGFPARTTLHGRFEIEVPWVHTGIALPPARHDAHHHRNLPDARDRAVLL